MDLSLFLMFFGRLILFRCGLSILFYFYFYYIYIHANPFLLKMIQICDLCQFFKVLFFLGLLTPVSALRHL